MKKDTVASLQEQEKELENRLFGAPVKPATTEETATESDAEAGSTPTEKEEAVTSPTQSATDEQHGAKRETTDDWEKRYKNLRASRDENLYKAKAELAAALDQISDLQAQLIEARKAQPTVDPFEGIFTEEDTDALGETTANVLRKATKAAAEAATKPLKEQLEAERLSRKERDKLYAEQVKREAYNVFLSRVAKAVPDWEDINYNPEFIKWMNEEDLDGTPRKTYFAEAEAQGNSALIIRYMLEFKNLSKPAPKKDKLAEKVTPVGEGAGATQVKTSEKVRGISRKYIDKFYDDLARGRYKGRHSEAIKIEAEIDKAVAEGRIVE